MGKNIIIIGMPGSGKSSFGRDLSEALSINFVDMDQYIGISRKRSIASMFEEGEAFFRDVEQEAAEELSHIKSTVISTGGGVVKRKAAMQALKESGYVIFIDRAVADIEQDVDRNTRPLLKDNSSALQKLYEERIDLYLYYADYTIKNDKNYQAVLDELVELAKELKGDED